MTERRDFHDVARAWLDLMPSEAPDRSVAAVLQAIERTPQVRRPLVAPWRQTQMNRFSILAAVAVLAVAIAGGALLLSSTQLPSAGASPSPSSTPLATAAPTAAPTVAPSPISQDLWGDWVADASIGLRDQGPRIQLSISWGDGADVLIQTNYTTGTQVFDSTGSSTTNGEIRLVAKATSDGCTAGDVGTYGWSTSSDLAFIDLNPIDDQCAARANALTRRWVRALNGVNSGGRGVLPVDNLELTLPHRKFGLSYLANGPYDKTFDTTGTIEFVGIRNPVPFKATCAAPPLVAGTPLVQAAKLAAYVKGLPDFTFTSATATIDGHPATHLIGTPKPGYVCPTGDLGFFTGQEKDWTISADNVQPLSVWITQNGSDAWLFWYSEDQVTSGDEAAVIGSIHFITQLPTR